MILIALGSEILESPSLIDERVLFRGLRFLVTRRRYVGTKGIFERDVVVFPEAVVVLPVIDDYLVLIKQFRAPFNDFIVEAPAGVVDKGETPDEAAVRELVEEIGYKPRKLVKLGKYTPAPGYSSEVLHFYVAYDLEYVGAKPERYEIIEPFQVKIEDAYRMVLSNQVTDMKTALAIMLYKSMKEAGLI